MSDNQHIMIPQRDLRLYFILSIGTMFFLAWERSIGISFYSKATGFSLTFSSMIKVYYGLIGLLLGNVFIYYKLKHLFIIWKYLIFLIISLSLLSINPQVSLNLLFLLLGIVSSLGVTLQRVVQDNLELKNKNSSLFSTKIWIWRL